RPPRSGARSRRESARGRVAGSAIARDEASARGGGAVYERFFGLVDAPFRLTPDPRYFFLSPKPREALAHLRLGLTEPGGFVCITGDIGTGKTTLLRTFFEDLGPEVAIAYVFNPALSAEELLQRIARELGVAAASGTQADLTDALNVHLLAERKAGRLSVVVLDEAQAVSIEVLEQLRLLSNLETSTEKLLRRVNARAVLQAYREIGTVPLRRWSPVRRRVEWAAAVATVVLAVITLGVPRLERRLPAALPDGGGRPSPAAPAVSEPPPSLAPAPLAVAATTSPAPAPPAPRVAPLATPTELEQRLAELDARRSARAALDAILAAWRVPGLGADEVEVPAQLEPMV